MFAEGSVETLRECRANSVQEIAGRFERIFLTGSLSRATHVCVP